MLTLKGKYNEAKVFTDNVDDNTIGKLLRCVINRLRRVVRFGSCPTRTVVKAV